jgi:hypothetical protein
MRLALAFGRTHAELARTLSAQELDDWALFCSEEPIGDLRADYAAAQIARAAARAESALEDFMPFHPKNIQARRDEADAAGTGTAEEFAALFGGVAVRTAK